MRVRPRSWVVRLAGILPSWQPMTALLQRWIPSVAVAATIVGAAPCQARAQHAAQPYGGTQVTVLAINAVLGGVTGGLAYLIRGEAPLEGVIRGAAGGAAVYAGKYVATRRTHGAGLVGRQIASVGSSVIGNTVAAHGPFDRVAIALGPLRWYVGPEVEHGRSWRIDVPAVIATAAGVVNPRFQLDIDASLSAGAFVFVAEEGGGFSLPGTIFYDRSEDPEREAYVLAHERAHVLQYDQAFLSWSDPLERRVDPTGSIHRYLELNLVGAGVGLAGVWIWPRHGDRPWELEAMRLAK